MGSQKISITVEDGALAWLRRRAKLVHGGNLSAAFAEATELARRQEALRAFLDAENVPTLAPSELDEITREWRGVASSAKRRSSTKKTKALARR